MRPAIVSAWICIAAFPSPAAAQAVFHSHPHAPIPNVSPEGLADSILVNAKVVVWDIDVGLALTHTWTGDLVITITDPLGATVTLMDRPGVPASTFGCSGDHPTIVADDEGTAGSIENDCQGGTSVAYAVGGRYTPNGALSDFDRGYPPGYWTLRAADVAGAGDIGRLETWSLHLEGAVLPGTEPPPDDTDVVLQVRPNPIGPAGDAVLSLGASADVRVDLYDSLGRAVTMLHTGRLSAGTHSLAFVAPTPGLYLLRAVVDERAITRSVAAR